MSKLGKISVIKREYGNQGMKTMQSELSRNGMTRIPGTGVFKYPYKELDGKYRTGLDPGAAYIRRIQDPLERKLEEERIEKTLARLKEVLGDIDLGPRSPFWNYSLAKSTSDTNHIQPVKLRDGDNFYDLSIPHQEIAFSWLRVHPTIASSYQAWERGEFPAETHYYVADEEIEQALIFRKKKVINQAIAKFDSMTPTKKKKVARMLGLAVSDASTEELVYNEVDNVLKKGEFERGKYQGLSTIEVFGRFADMEENLLHIKDLVAQALTHSIYRSKPSGRIYEGEYEIAKTEDELVKYLIDEDHQDELLTLESKLKAKKLTVI
jgi:hypothetical protein